MEHTAPEFVNLINHLGERIGRQLTEREQTMVGVWSHEYGFDSEIISLILDEGLSRGITDFIYLSAIARNWYQWGVKSVDDAKRYRGGRSFPTTIASLLPQIRAGNLTLDVLGQALEAVVAQVKVVTDRVNALEGRVRMLEQENQHLIADAQNAFRSVDDEFGIVRDILVKHADGILKVHEDVRKLRLDLGG